MILSISVAAGLIKAKVIDKYLVPVLKDSGLSSKVFGWGDWQDGLCSGKLPDRSVSAFFNSGRVAPCISEPHTHRYGIDLPERVFKTALCGAFGDS